MSALRAIRQADGNVRLQGVFTLRDRDGFPVDMAFEMARERGWVVDWVEALADAGRQCVLKCDALADEMRMLDPCNADAAWFVFQSAVMEREGTFQERCAATYEKMSRQ
jgi:hypothetical protein